MQNQFQKISTPLDDVFIIKRFSHHDQRGLFTKTYNLNMFQELDLGRDLEVKESLCSISKKNVIRGMHYQRQPHGCAKIMSVVKGKILDVMVGLGSDHNRHNKGKFFSVELSADNNDSIYVPDGYANGFLVLSDEVVVVYHQTSHFNADADTGIRFDSFGFSWPIDNPILSEKDTTLPAFSDVFG